MAQSNYNIPNESAPAVRAQLNAVFGSIATNNSGSSAPTTTFAHQWWYDTTTNILKQRNAADSAWIDVGTFDQSGGTFTPAGIVELSQGQVEDDTSTVFGTVSGQRLAQHSDDYAEKFTFGVDQEWVEVTSSRERQTTYQNTTDKPITVSVYGNGGFLITDRNFEVSVDASTWVIVGRSTGFNEIFTNTTFVVPAEHYYRFNASGGTINTWSELR